MTEEQVRDILKDYIGTGNTLWGGAEYVCYPVACYNEDGEPIPGNDITLDGTFTLDEVEAIVWWVRNKPLV